MNSLPKTITRQRRDCDLKAGPSAPKSSTLTTRLPSHPRLPGNFPPTTGNFKIKLYTPIAVHIYTKSTEFYSIISNFHKVMPY